MITYVCESDADHCLPRMKFEIRRHVVRHQISLARVLAAEKITQEMAL
jgi:hypothetical protein